MPNPSSGTSSGISTPNLGYTRTRPFLASRCFPTMLRRLLKMPRGKTVKWDTVKEVPGGLKEGKDALSTLNDEGRVQNPQWTAEAGGSTTRRMFGCNSHKECPVRARLLMEGATTKVQLNDAEHSEELNPLDRSNSKLTRAEKAEMRKAREYGGTPVVVCSKMSKKEVLSGAPVHKRTEGGLEGALFPLHYRRSCTPPQSAASDTTA